VALNPSVVEASCASPESGRAKLDYTGRKLFVFGPEYVSDAAVQSNSEQIS